MKFKSAAKSAHSKWLAFAALLLLMYHRSKFNN